MPTRVNDYANFVLAELQEPQGSSSIVHAEKESRNRVLLSVKKEGRVDRFRLLMFAVGGSGRERADERRVEITSTYAGGLKRDPSIVYVVLGVERDQRLLVGIDAERLKHGGPTSNASTFVYSVGFDSIGSKTHEVFVNPSKLISDEHQIYMKPSFLLDYLDNAQSLHRLGVIAAGKEATKLPRKKSVSPDDPTVPRRTAKLTFAEQIRLAMLKMEVGQAGERRVVTRERKRLIGDGHPDLAAKVCWVSQTHPFVGYDVSSFAQAKKPDVVEVKSSTGDLKRFHFSNNELRVAESRRDAYRIVCVSNVFAKPTFFEIKDPVSKLESGALSKMPDGYIVSL